MSDDAFAAPVFRALELKAEFAAALQRSIPAEWPLQIDEFLAAIQCVRPPLPSGAMHLLLADVARDLTRLAGTRNGTLLAIFGADVPSNVTCRGEALCRRFAASLRDWCDAQEPGSLAPGMVARRIMEYIEAHYHERISLKVLAAVSGWNERYLSKTFRSIIGMSIRDYLESVRIDQAAARLRAGAKVESLVADVGWRGGRNFFKQFKKRIGLIPGEYRAAYDPVTPALSERNGISPEFFIRIRHAALTSRFITQGRKTAIRAFQ